MHSHLEKKGEQHADGSLKSLDEHSMDRRVEFKCGMPVVLLANLDLDQGLFVTAARASLPDGHHPTGGSKSYR
jgi:hypothetical protein